TAMQLMSQLEQAQRSEVEQSPHYSTIRPAFQSMYIICSTTAVTAAVQLLVPLSHTCIAELVRVYLPNLFAAAKTNRPTFLELIPDSEVCEICILRTVSYF